MWRALAVLLAVSASGAAFAQAAPSAYTSATRYDAERRVVGTIAPDPDGVGALKYAAVRNTYDAAGRVVKVEKGELSSWQSESVAPASWGTAFSVQQTIDTSYDALDRKTNETVTAGATVQKVTQYSYDSYGRLDCTAVRMDPAQWSSQSDACVAQVTGPNGPDRISRNIYDVAGELVQVRQGVGTTVERAEATYSYTVNGKRDYVIDAEGARAELTYDGFDRQDKWLFPSTTRPAAYDATSQASALASAGSLNSADYEQYGYDANGNRTSLRRRDGRTLTFAYDALGRVSSKVVPDGCPPIQPAGTGCPAASATRDVYYAYDLMGHQLAARFDSASGADALTSDYDGFGELTSSTTAMGTFSKSLTAQYDANGNRTQLTHPENSSTFSFTYGYDGLDRLTGVYQGVGTATPLDTFTYNASALLGSRSENAGSSVTYGYDTIDRLTSQADAFTTSAINVSWTLGYNSASQIKSETRVNDAYAFGGLVTVNRNYGVNGLNQYVSAGTATFTYDGNGNLTGDGTNRYVYDGENRLVSASAGTVTTTLTYDPSGRLFEVLKKTGTMTNSDTRFLYDGDALALEYDSGNKVLNRYVHGSNAAADDPLVWYSGANVASATRKWLHADHLGSIIAATNSNGGSPTINTYDEYGIPGASNTGRFQYTGQAWIGELGKHYYKARMYSPTLGRFMQTDPIGYNDQINLYAYVEDDPVNASDPTGESANEHLDDVLQGRVPGAVAPERAASSAVILGKIVGTAASVVPAVRIFMRVVQAVEGSQAAQNTTKAGTQTAERPNGVPKHFEPSPTTKSGGTKYTDPANPHNNVRDMPGNPNSPNPAQQNPYVKENVSGATH